MLWAFGQYEYDELSRRTKATLFNDANAIYEYDLVNRLEKLTNNIDDGNSIVFDYSNYDKVGNRLSMKIDDANTHVYTYDEIYRLTNVDYNDGNSTSYAYDSLGNRTDVNESGSATDYNSNSLNQYSSVGGTGYSYDKNGNLTNDGTTSYYYDCENRMMASKPSGQPWTTYKYDYAGRRVTKTTIGVGITKYCYDGDQVIHEYDGSDTLLRTFIYGPGIDEPIYMNDGANHWYHFDGLGSVVAISDGSGKIEESYEYDVFGKPTIYDANGSEITDSNIGNPYMFTGRRLDPETGLYYYRARYYSADIGRFLQTDPIGYEDGLNLYTYVRNNPVNLVDPKGEGWLTIIFVVGAVYYVGKYLLRLQRCAVWYDRLLAKTMSYRLWERHRDWMGCIDFEAVKEEVFSSKEFKKFKKWCSKYVQSLYEVPPGIRP